MKVCRLIVLFLASICGVPLVGQQLDVRPLPIGEMVGRPLSVGEAHFYSIELKKGEALHIDAEEKNLNFRVVLIRPIDQAGLADSNFGHGFQRETLTFHVQKAGIYVVMIDARQSKMSGSYQLRANLSAGLTDEYRERIKAESLLKKGLANQNKQTAEGLREARSDFDEVLSIWKRLDDKYWSAVAFDHLGSVYSSLGEQRKSLTALSKSLVLFKTVGDKSGIASTLNNMGADYILLGENLKALDSYNKALPLAKAIGDKRGEAYVYISLGAVYSRLGEKEKSIDFFERALPILIKITDKSGEANALNHLGTVYADLGEYKGALRFYNQSLALRHSNHDIGGEANTLSNIGGIYSFLGENLNALRFYNRALGLFRGIGDKNGRADVLSNIGGVYDSQGERKDALSYYNRALTIFENVGDKRGQITTLSNIGSVYSSLGEKQKALVFLKQGLIIARSIGTKKLEATTLNNIGTLYKSLGKNKRSLHYFNKALAIFVAIKSRLGEARTRNNLGVIHRILHDYNAAVKQFGLVFSIVRAIGDKRGEAMALTNIADIFGDLGREKSALKNFKKALPVFREVGDKNGEAQTLTLMMDTAESLKNSRLAIFYGKQSVNKYQELRHSAYGLENKTQKSFLKSIRYSYQKLAELLIKAQKFDQAVEVLALYQDQQFFDFYGLRTPSIRSVAFSPLEQEFVTRYEIAGKLIEDERGKTEAVKQEFRGRASEKEKFAQLQMIHTRARHSADLFLKVLSDAATQFAKKPSARDQIGRIGEVVKIGSALEKLAFLTKQETAMLYTMIGEEKFYTILLTSDGQVKSFESPISSDEFDKKVLKFYALLRSPSYDPRPLGKELYNIIIKPLRSELRKKNIKTIMWRLDGNLRYIPMSALFNGKKYLIEEFQNVLFTRSDTERILKGVTANWTGTGFGSSQKHIVDLLGDGEKILFSALPGVASELNSIFEKDKKGKQIIPGEVILDAQFTKDVFYRVMKKKQPIVHISSHFSFRPGDDTRSFLLLGDGSTITLREMKEREGLFRNVELLTLSACNTAAIRADADGKEIDGFAELAQRLGAGAVMATLWQVSDASTPMLMRSFYRNRQYHQGMTKTEALQKAQLTLLRGNGKTKVLPIARNGEKGSRIKVIVLPDSDRRNENRNVRGSPQIFLGKSEAPKFKVNKNMPFAHPYYWSPFVLTGNWR